jgi:hypothetical protein
MENNSINISTPIKRKANNENDVDDIELTPHQKRLANKRVN